jgi:hypothetical protein
MHNRCTAWALTLRAAHTSRLNLFPEYDLKNNIFTKEILNYISRRKLLSEELHSLYSSPDIAVLRSGRILIGKLLLGICMLI